MCGETLRVIQRGLNSLSLEDICMTAAVIASYMCLGAVAGFLAGLFGVGGGIIIVPMMLMLLSVQGIASDVAMYLALGTSMASIMFTAVSSFISHHLRGAVLWSVVLKIVPGLLAGTFLGSCVAARMPVVVLKIFFVVFLSFVSVQMILDRKPKPSRELPQWPGMLCVSSVIGAVSSWVGIGGGLISVPFLIWCNVAAHRAIGTSSAIGFPIAVAGAAGYIVNGLHAAGLPRYSLGYVYLPGLACIVCASLCTAPLGAKLAHILPVNVLKKILAVFLLAVAVRMVFGLCSVKL